MAEHGQLGQRLAIQIFFVDPYSPWHCGMIHPLHLELETTEDKTHRAESSVELPAPC